MGVSIHYLVSYENSLGMSGSLLAMDTGIFFLFFAFYFHRFSDASYTVDEISRDGYLDKHERTLHYDPQIIGNYANKEKHANIVGIRIIVVVSLFGGTGYALNHKSAATQTFVGVVYPVVMCWVSCYVAARAYYLVKLAKDFELECGQRLMLSLLPKKVQ